MMEISNKIEIDRITNLVLNFGWSKAKEEITDSDLILTFKKTRTQPIPEEAVGPD